MFNSYLRTVVRPILQKTVSRMQVSVMMELLAYLEQCRYDFSKDRAFQTRPVSNAEIAEHFNVDIRSVRRWMALLERLGIVERQFRKNPHHKFKNLLSRFGLRGFKTWFQTQMKDKTGNLCPPNKKDIKDIYINPKYMKKRLSREPAVGESNQERPFPTSGSIRYSDPWKAIALQHLPSGRGRPCMDMIAQRFRENLKLYKISFSHPSVKNRWINFCQRAKPVS